MDRRGFLRWLGGGVAAVVALSQDKVLEAQQLFGVTGEVDPASLLWMPGEAKIVLPAATPLVLTERRSGVACFRVTQTGTYGKPGGTFWFDADWKLVDALDRNGQPTSIFGPDGPNVTEARRAIGPVDGGSWRTDIEKRRSGHVPTYYGGVNRRFDVRTNSGLYVSCWPELIYEPTDRPVVVTASVGPLSTDGVY